MRTPIFISIDTFDADSILLLLNKKTDESCILFDFAQEVADSGEECQFTLTVTPELLEWCRCIIKDEDDNSGVIEQIIQNYAFKTGQA